MAGETDLHKTLKKEACRWLFRMGYRCIAAEVRLRPLGIIDAVGTGIFRPFHNYLFIPRELPQVCFIECKASRADFLRDHSNDGQMMLCLMERERNRRSNPRKGRRPVRLRDDARRLHASAGPRLSHAAVQAALRLVPGLQHVPRDVEVHVFDRLLPRDDRGGRFGPPRTRAACMATRADPARHRRRTFDRRDDRAA